MVKRHGCRVAFARFYDNAQQYKIDNQKAVRDMSVGELRRGSSASARAAARRAARGGGADDELRLLRRDEWARALVDQRRALDSLRAAGRARRDLQLEREAFAGAACGAPPRAAAAAAGARSRPSPSSRARR